MEATRRLEIVARQFEGACLSRLGGDEFALLLPDVSLAEMRWVCAGLLNRLRQPVSLGAAEIEVGTSIGLVMLGADRHDVDDVLRDADLAMYSAKSAGKNRWTQFVPAMHDDLVARLTLEGELAIAIDQDQLDVHYQPLVRLDGRRIVGAEALVRWNHPTRGPIPPEEFLVAAERGPLIHRLGAWILKAACQQLVDWSAELGADMLDEVAVNVSPRQLLDPHFADTVAEALAVTGLDPGRLVLEITESTAMAPNSFEQLLALRAAGVRLAIDDFGTGHSSLSRLAVLPVDTLKVDRSFIRGDPGGGRRPAGARHGRDGAQPRARRRRRGHRDRAPEGLPDRPRLRARPGLPVLAPCPGHRSGQTPGAHRRVSAGQALGRCVDASGGPRVGSPCGAEPAALSQGWTTVEPCGEHRSSSLPPVAST